MTNQYGYAPKRKPKRTTPMPPRRKGTRVAGEPYPEPKTSLSPEDKEHMRQWREAGFTALEIARAYNCHVTTVNVAIRTAKAANP